MCKNRVLIIPLGKSMLELKRDLKRRQETSKTTWRIRVEKDIKNLDLKIKMVENQNE